MTAGERVRIEEGLGSNERLKDRGRPVGAQGYPRLERARWVCNGCPKRHGNSSCYRRRVVYDARVAEALSAGMRSESRRGIDMDGSDAGRALGQVFDVISRRLSPYQASQTMDEDVRVSPSTIYERVGRGYGGCANAMLERKVKFKKRRPEERSHRAFLALPEDERGGRWEMDTVPGRASGRTRLPTLTTGRRCPTTATPCAPTRRGPAKRTIPSSAPYSPRGLRWRGWTSWTAVPSCRTSTPRPDARWRACRR